VGRGEGKSKFPKRPYTRIYVEKAMRTAEKEGNEGGEGEVRSLTSGKKMG